jgi:DNA-binding transcriptional LysR family regulator
VEAGFVQSPDSPGVPDAREADIAIGVSRAQHIRVTSRRLVDSHFQVYGSRSYLEGSPPIHEKRDLEKHSFIGFIEEFLFDPELNFPRRIGQNLQARLRSTNFLAQIHATLSGNGLCVLPVFLASVYPDLVPVLPEEISAMRTLYMHIHEDYRNVPHVREVAEFIVQEVETCKSCFSLPGIFP